MPVLLNESLIKNQGLNQEDIEYLEKLHDTREKLFEMMTRCDPTNLLHKGQLDTYVLLLESLEFNMQRAWRFALDSSKHTWWVHAPHCKCPKMDNADPLMNMGGRIINGNCPLHGKQ